MDGPLSNWLSLREPADFAARSTALTRAIAARLGGGDPLRVVDLGAGTGSNVRYLFPHLPPRQDWLLIDRDPVLLAEARERLAQANTSGVDLRIDTRQMDLGSLSDDSIFTGRHLVTASALLDLVSDSWLRSLARHCDGNGALALFALTYNGKSRCTPPEPEDDWIRELMNRHQKTDKGFAPAAGPDAAAAAERAFSAVGYEVRCETTDWVLGSEHHDLQRQLIEGWAHAAQEIAPDQTAAIVSWLSRRLAHLDQHRSGIVVSHEDLAAWPGSVR